MNAALPPVEPPPGAGEDGSSRRPRNYLAGTERRRLFWRFMPPAVVLFLALSWLERAWLPPSRPPAPPQVDTRLKSAHVERTVDDAVVIEAEPDAFVSAADELGASSGSLASVRDDTVFRQGDEEAWFQIWMTLRSTDAAALDRADARSVSFIELFGQPRSFRGRLVRFKGTVHRLQRVEAPPNDYDISGYWQAWVEPDDGPASPIVVYFLRLPDGMPRGFRVREPIEVVGYFFKRWAYEAQDAIRTAPLVMALEPSWRPLPSPPAGGTTIGAYALAAMAGLVVVTLLAMRLSGRGALHRGEPRPENLAETLAGVELFSTAEALRRLAVTDRAEPPATGPGPPPVPQDTP